MPPRNQARDRALYPRPKTPRLYGPLGKGVLQELPAAALIAEIQLEFLQ